MSNNKYTKSVNGIQCIGPCRFKNTKSEHPTTLQTISAPYNYCPIIPQSGLDKSIVLHDECIFPEDDIGLANSDWVYPPIITFQSYSFVKDNYNISTYNDALNWFASNNNVPFKTCERVFDNCIIAFKNDFLLIINDTRILKYVTTLLSENVKYMTKKLINNLSINVAKSTIDLTMPQNNLHMPTTFYELKLSRAYIRKMFITEPYINEFMSQSFYESDYSDTMSKYIVTKFIDYIRKHNIKSNS